MRYINFSLKIGTLEKEFPFIDAFVTVNLGGRRNLKKEEFFTFNLNNETIKKYILSFLEYIPHCITSSTDIPSWCIADTGQNR